MAHPRIEFFQVRVDVEILGDLGEDGGGILTGICNFRVGKFL